MAKILMIDDDPVSIEDVKDVLSADYEVGIADNIDDAVDMLKKNSYDLLFLDLYMPHGKRYSSDDTKQGRETGYLLLKEIRSDKQDLKTKRNIPVIVLTFIRMEMDPELRDRLLKEQPLYCLEKPEDLLEIVRLVKSMLS